MLQSLQLFLNSFKLQSYFRATCQSLCPKLSSLNVLFSRAAFRFSCPSHQEHRAQCTLEGGWHKPPCCFLKKKIQSPFLELPRRDDLTSYVLWDSAAGGKNPREGSLKAAVGRAEPFLGTFPLTTCSPHQPLLFCLSGFYFASSSLSFYLTSA